MYNDTLSQTWDLEALEREKDQAVKFVKDYLQEVDAASRKLKDMEFGVGGSKNLMEVEQLMKKVDGVTKEHAVSIKKLADAELTLAKAREVNARAAKMEEQATLAKTKVAEADLKIKREQEKQDRANAKAVEDFKKSVNAGKKELDALTKSYDKQIQAGIKSKQVTDDEAAQWEELKKVRKDLQKEIDTSIRNTDRELSAIQNKKREYEILNETHKRLVKSAQDIGASQGIESAAFKETAAQANVLDAKLKAIDGQLGNHRRNVGNYTTQWNGLGYSVQQIVRELPSLSGGFATFFSAIGNNVPMLKDKIDELRASNKALAAEGQATTPIWKSIGASLLSWNTAIVAILTILTVYGKDIIGFFTNAARAAKEALIANLDLRDAVDDVVQSYQYLNKEVDRTEKLALARSKAKGDDIKEQTEIEKKAIQQRIDNLNAYTKQLIEQQGALESYLQRAPATSGITEKDVKEATAQLNKIKDAYKKATEERIDLTNELTVKDYELQEQLRKKKERDDAKADKKSLRDLQQTVDEARRIRSDIAKADAEFRIADVKTDMEHQKALIENEKTSDDERMAARYQYHVDLIALAEIEKEKEDAINEEKHKATLADISRLSDKTERERLTLLENERYTKQHYANIETATQKSNAALVEYVDASQEDIQKSDDKALKLRIANLKALTHANDDAAKTTSETWEQHIDKILNKLKVLQEALQLFSEIGNAFSQLENARVQAADVEIRKIEERKQQRIDEINATSLTEGQKRERTLIAEKQAQALEKEQEKKKIEAQQRVAKFERAASIASVIAKTAEAVVAALKIPIYGEALAIERAAVGAAQLATVVATPIPQYAEGTEYHKGGPAIYGEAGPEVVKEPGKTAYMVDKPTLGYLPVGTQVTPINAIAAGIGFMTPSVLKSQSDINLGSLQRTISNEGASTRKALKQLPQTQFQITGKGIEKVVSRGNTTNRFINDIYH